MDLIKANVVKMEAQLKDWGRKIEDFAEKADDVGSQVKIDYHKHLRDLKVKQKEAQSKFDEFKEAGIDKWDVFKSGIEQAWDDAESAFKSLKS